MKNFFAFILIFLAGILITTTGCGTNRSNIKQMYAGENLPSSQIAVLTSPGTAIRVVSINGEKIGTFPWKNVFELLPGDYTLELYLSTYKVIRGNQVARKSGLGTVNLSFKAKKGFEYFIRAFEFYAKDGNIYTIPYQKISIDNESQTAMKCKEILSVNFQPENSELRWYPFILEYGQRYHISKHVVDWRYKGVAQLLPEEKDKEFKHICDIIQEQQNLAIDCIGEDSKKYFSDILIYEFPLKYY